VWPVTGQESGEVEPPGELGEGEAEEALKTLDRFSPRTARRMCALVYTAHGDGVCLMTLPPRHCRAAPKTG
jgi:hypothetical protein